MGRYFVSLVIWFVVCQVGVAQEQAHNPAEVLSRAVSKARLCPYETTREKLDENHRHIEFVPKADDEDTRQAERLSLYLMFRPGRYELEDVVREATFDDREALTVRFWPQPEEKRLKHLKGEDERYHWAMNRLAGKVFVDKETRGFIQVEARLPFTAPYEALGITVFKLHELTFLMDQKLWSTEWLPDKIEMELHYTHRRKLFPLLWREVHEKYTLHFNCGPA
jgi:hypothetical protein